MWFFVAVLGALFFIHLEQVCRQRFSVLRQELQARRKAPKIVGGRKAGKYIPGRRAGEEPL